MWTIEKWPSPVRKWIVFFFFAYWRASGYELHFGGENSVSRCVTVESAKTNSILQWVGIVWSRAIDRQQIHHREYSQRWHRICFLPNERYFWRIRCQFICKKIQNIHLTRLRLFLEYFFFLLVEPIVLVRACIRNDTQYAPSLEREREHAIRVYVAGANLRISSWASTAAGLQSTRIHRNNFTNMRHPCTLTTKLKIVCIELHVIRHNQNKLHSVEWKWNTWD